MSSEEGFLNKLLFHSSDRQRGESDLHKFIDQIHSNHGKELDPGRKTRCFNRILRRCLGFMPNSRRLHAAMQRK